MVVCVFTLREQLAEHRRAGLPFGSAWVMALGALPAEDRREWAEVLEGTASSWEDAYTRRGQGRAQRALEAIGSDPEREDPTHAADPWERPCAGCGRAIAPDRRSTARFCDRECWASYKRAA